MKAESSRAPSSASDGADGSLNSLWCSRSGTEYFFFGRRYWRMQTSSGEIITREFNKLERVRSLQPQRKQSASFSCLCVLQPANQARHLFSSGIIVPSLTETPPNSPETPPSTTVEFPLILWQTSNSSKISVLPLVVGCGIVSELLLACYFITIYYISLPWCLIEAINNLKGIISGLLGLLTMKHIAWRKLWCDGNYRINIREDCLLQPNTRGRPSDLGWAHYNR